MPLSIITTSNLISGFKQSQNFDPYRPHNWTIAFDDPALEALSLAVEVGQSPTVNNQIVTLPFGNDSIKLAGQAEHPELQFSFRDFVDPGIRDILQAWAYQVYDPTTGAIGFARDYKKNGTLFSHAVNGSVLRSWLLEGIWPSTRAFGSLDHKDGAGHVLVDITFTYDRAIDKATRAGTPGGPPKGPRGTGITPIALGNV